MPVLEQQIERLVDRLASLICANSLEAPSLIVLGMFSPMAFFASQIMLLVQPLFGWDGNGWLTGGGADLLGEPATIDRLLSRLGTGREQRGIGEP